MSPLHGLRLNCLLAPLLAATVGAMAVLLGALWHRDDLAAVAEAADRTAINGLAQLSEQNGVVLAAWHASHPAWLALARVSIQGEVVTIQEQTGPVTLRGGPPLGLLLAYQGVQAWNERGLCAVAAPCLPHQGAASIIVGWREPAADPPWWPWLALAGGALLLGGGCGVYLVTRVYLPVEWMERAVAAAAAGELEPPGGADSPETASLRSSIATLISQRKHSDLADAKSRH